MRDFKFFTALPVALLGLAIAGPIRAGQFTLASVPTCVLDPPIVSTGTTHAVADFDASKVPGHCGDPADPGVSHAEAFASPQSVQIIESQFFDGSYGFATVQVEARSDFSFDDTGFQAALISFRIQASGAGNLNGAVPNPLSPYDATLTLFGAVDHLGTTPMGEPCPFGCMTDIDKVITLYVTGLPGSGTVDLGVVDLFAEGAVNQGGEHFSASVTVDITPVPEPTSLLLFATLLTCVFLFPKLCRIARA